LSYAVGVRFLDNDLLRRLCLARAAIHDRSSHPLTLDDLARVAGLSRFHFLRLFHEAFSATPHEYLTRVRLGRARQLLLEERASVTDVCFEVGFQSLGSFSALFARRMGESPATFRRRFIQVPGARQRVVIPCCYFAWFSNSGEAPPGGPR
jgi:AraC-like DNA-binding protein